MFLINEMKNLDNDELARKEIENYSNIINYLQNLLDKNNIQYTVNEEEEQSNDTCPKDAYYENDSCVCKDTTKKFDKETKTCK